MKREGIVMAKKRDNWFNYQLNKNKEYIKDAKTDYKKGFNLLIIISIVMVFLICVYPFYSGTFYNCNSDDIVQYYPFVAGFIILSTYSIQNLFSCFPICLHPTTQEIVFVFICHYTSQI
jgi:hypothetical protein